MPAERSLPAEREQRREAHFSPTAEDGRKAILAADAVEPVELIPMDRTTWEGFLRWAPLAAEAKYVGLMMASYSTYKTGANVHPGDELLAADCGKSIRTIERNRQALVRAGFLELQPKRRRDDANEYQLTVPANFNELPGARGPDGGPPKMPKRPP